MLAAVANLQIIGLERCLDKAFASGASAIESQIKVYLIII